jgi:heme exporter protein A
MAEWAIETHDLRKRYGYRPVLAGVDLYVKPGEFLVLLGPNGAGKSTFIRILCTLMKPSGGTAKVAGYSIIDDPDSVRANIGLIGHSSYLYEDLTAVENLCFYLRMRGVDAIGAGHGASGTHVFGRHEKAAVHCQGRGGPAAHPVFRRTL